MAAYASLRRLTSPRVGTRVYPLCGPYHFPLVFGLDGVVPVWERNAYSPAPLLLRRREAVPDPARPGKKLVRERPEASALARWLAGWGYEYLIVGDTHLVMVGEERHQEMIKALDASPRFDVLPDWRYNPTTRIYRVKGEGE